MNKKITLWPTKHYVEEKTEILKKKKKNAVSMGWLNKWNIWVVAVIASYIQNRH
jgi:hypothetical protein